MYTKVRKRIYTDNKKLIGIDGFTRADNGVPVSWSRVIRMILTCSMRITGEIVRDQNDIVFLLIQLTIAFPSNLYLLNRLTVICGKTVDLKTLFFNQQRFGAQRQAYQ